MESKRKSLEWAIDELEKQKGIISSKLEIANKREQTSSIIAEVNAQKDALLKKITTLEEGLKTTTELVADPLIKLEEELDCVTDKLEIAKDRLVSLEQEQYLEELGKKLNGEFIPEQETFSESITSKTRLSTTLNKNSWNSLLNTTMINLIPQTQHKAKIQVK